MIFYNLHILVSNNLTWGMNIIDTWMSLSFISPDQEESVISWLLLKIFMTHFSAVRFDFQFAWRDDLLPA